MKTNVLYFEDNLDVLREKIADDSIDLCYCDPPFNSNRNFFVLFKDRTGKSSTAQENAFEDTWTWNEDSETAFKELVVGCPDQDLATTVQALRQFLRETPMQILTVADLLAHTAKARYPAQDKTSLLGYKAGKQKKSAAGQSDLFAGD